ncbi:MAG: hypothetical protein ACQXXJ_06905 [Candidatus Bathyarchaeia archaeon]
MEGQTMCMARVTLSCPRCQQELIVTRPDSSHSCWSFDKPKDKELEADVVEQLYVCKNPSCKAKFTVYWYDTQMYLTRA